MKTCRYILAVIALVVGLAQAAWAEKIWLLQPDGTITQQTGTGSAADVNLANQLGGEHVGVTEEEGYIRVQPRAGTTGGASPSRYISVGTTEDEHAVCTAACTVYSIAVTNVNAAVRYLKCNNATAANTTPGTSVPEIDLAVPGATAGAGITLTFPVGMSFDTALTCWLVTGAAESDVAEVAANELKVLYSYKQ